MPRSVTCVIPGQPFALRWRRGTTFLFATEIQRTETQTLARWLREDSVDGKYDPAIHQKPGNKVYPVGIRRQIVTLAQTPLITCDEDGAESRCPQMMVVAEVRGGSRPLVSVVAREILKQCRAHAREIVKPEFQAVPFQHQRDDSRHYPSLRMTDYDFYWEGRLALPENLSSRISDPRVTIWTVKPGNQLAPELNLRRVKQALRQCANLIDNSTISEVRRPFGNAYRSRLDLHPRPANG